AGGPGGGLTAVDLADGQGGGGDPAGRRRTDRGRAVLLDRPPGLALGAAAEPLGRLPAAFRAAEGRAVLGGLRTGSHAEKVAAASDSGASRTLVTPGRAARLRARSRRGLRAVKGSCPRLRDRFTLTD